MLRVAKVLIAAVLILTGLVTAWDFVDRCALFEISSHTDPVCMFVYNYQSLVAGVLAVGAAILALLPVYGQLELTRLQSAIMTREVLVKRLKETEGRRARAKSDLEKITVEFDRDIYQGNPEGDPNIGYEWAFNAEQIVEDVVRKFRRHQASRVDPKSVNIALGSVIAAAEALAICLDRIHTPARQPWDDPELGLSAEEMKAAEVAADAEAKIAEKELPTKLSGLSKIASKVENAYIAVVERLRTRIRDLDDFILSEDL